MFILSKNLPGHLPEQLRGNTSNLFTDRLQFIHFIINKKALATGQHHIFIIFRRQGDLPDHLIFGFTQLVISQKFLPQSRHLFPAKSQTLVQIAGITAKAADQPAAPKWYAVFPILPIALLIIFSKLVVASIKLDTMSALFMVWIGVVIIEIIRSRDVKKVFKDGLAMFQSMGKMFAGIVALIICAEFFATGLKVSGLIDILINSAQGVGAGMGAMTVILTAIVSIVTFLTGSGVGAYSSFATLAPDVAAGLGGSVAELVTPMQFASGLLRAMSPVAGVIIAVAGAAGVSPMAIVRRTWIPMILGIITAIIANEIFIG